MLAHDPRSMLGAASVGVMGAATAQLIARSRMTRRRPALAELPPEPVLNG
jgi:hypothetical protein